MELRIIYKKRTRKRVQMLKEMQMDAKQKITFDYIHVNLSSNLFIWVMIFEQIYRRMKKEASIKNDLMKRIINTEFLRENLLKQDFEIQNERYLHETRLPNVMILDVNATKIECIMFTKEEKNTMKLLIEDYKLNTCLENRILSSKMTFDNLELLSETLKNHYLQTSGLVFQDIRYDKYDDNMPRDLILEFNTIDLFYN